MVSPALILVCAITIAPLSPTDAIAAKTTFKGKTVEWVVPLAENARARKWARFLARPLGAALPGAPSILTRTMPGSDPVKSANTFASAAEGNGLTILATAPQIGVPAIWGDSRVSYSLADWRVVLALPDNGVVYVRRSLGIKSAKDLANLAGRTLRYASARRPGEDMVALLGFEMLGLDVKPLFRAGGREAAIASFQRGATDIDVQASNSYLSKVRPMVNGGGAIPIMTWGIIDSDGKLARDPAFPNLPHFGEVYKMIHGKERSGPAYEAWLAFFVARYGMGNLLVLPKDTPRQIVTAYDRAVARVVAKPGFAAKSRKLFGGYRHLVGKDARERAKLMTKVDADAIRWVRGWLKRKYGASN